MDRDTFMATAHHAAVVAKMRGAPINPAIAAAMAAHETGFGASTPPNSFNILGIKAGTSWDGPTVNAETHEYTPAGERYGTSANWRVYPSIEACFEDYGNIIRRLWWYEDAEQTKDDPRAFLAALKPIYSPSGEVIEPGYFTDPEYVTKVWSIVEAYNLIPDERRRTSKRLKIHSDGNFASAFEIPAGKRVVIALEPDGNINADIRSK